MINKEKSVVRKLLRKHAKEMVSVIRNITREQRPIVLNWLMRKATVFTLIMT